MRLHFNVLALLVVILVSACDYWPRELKPLAKSISQQVSGETTVWLAGGDVVVINVAGSPRYRQPQRELEALAIDIAEQAIGFAATPLESIAITFHESEVTEDSGRMREFIFLVIDDRAVLQPYLEPVATGPLTQNELQTVIDRLGGSLTVEQKECALGEVEKRAQVAGDPETLDPASVEFLTAETWYELDEFGKRIILVQAIVTKALFVCASRGQVEVTS